ncbi:MAG: prepilin-type N-terminal cleavage/methylation domain-containing protein [Sedimentisphaerales bacterium]|nr:prepilin-type N-terminal cleavage/methylation domain-containing protein [Sedimentisphaerales bacterium]
MKRVANIKGFTIVELMVAVLIVAILAAGAVPIYRAKTDSAKWSEGKAIMGTIGTALRAYLALKGNHFKAIPTLDELGVLPGSLDGTYFKGGESGVGAFSWVVNSYDPLDFLVTAEAPEDISSPSKITMDEHGQFTITP